jgi:uncharacterized membrane protein YgcG
MNRPIRHLLCCCAAAMLVGAGAGHGQEVPGDAEKPISATGALPELPENGLLDEASVFGEEEGQSLAADLEDFRQRVGIPLFVVTANYIYGGTLEEFGERLVKEGLGSRSGIILLFERGSGQLNYSATPGALGRSEDMQRLFLFGSRAAAALPVSATTAQRLRAAVQALTAAGGQWKSGGALPDPDAAPPAALPVPASEAETPPAPAPAAEVPPVPSIPRSRPGSSLTPRSESASRQVIAGVAAALLAGAAFLFGYHRWQERQESRIHKALHFPEVMVGRRLGAAQGGGVVAAISFAEKR